MFKYPKNLVIGGDYMDVRERIYKIMEAGNMCQAAVARAAGLSPHQFNNILRGRGKLNSENIPSICKALNITPNDLFISEA